MEEIVVLAASAITTLVGLVILLYLHATRQRVRRHILRNEEIREYLT
jgi:hypothetical protein